MYQFIWPFVLLILPLPFLVRAVMRPAQNQQATDGALKVPFFGRLKKLPGTIYQSNRLVHPLFWSLAWICLVLAASRPVWLGTPIALNQEARNIVLALDVSGSMEENDFDLKGRPQSRLDMVKRLATDFIEKRQGDNLGLVIFGSEAYAYAPLSPDTKTLTSLLDEIGIGIAGTQTAMGDALAMAVQTVAAIPEKARIVILMSDGFANAGTVPMTEALQLAENANVKVYTIGIGSDKKTVQDFLGFVQINPSLDLDEEMLRNVADKTGGQYFRAKSTADLQKIYGIIDTLETTEAESITVRPRREMAWVFLVAALVLWLVAFSIGGRQ